MSWGVSLETPLLYGADESRDSKVPRGYNVLRQSAMKGYIMSFSHVFDSNLGIAASAYLLAAFVVFALGAGIGLWKTLDRREIFGCSLLWQTIGAIVYVLILLNSGEPPTFGWSLGITAGILQLGIFGLVALILHATRRIPDGSVES